jgi:hypothetical protein
MATTGLSGAHAAVQVPVSILHPPTTGALEGHCAVAVVLVLLLKEPMAIVFDAHLVLISGDTG